MEFNSNIEVEALLASATVDTSKVNTSNPFLPLSPGIQGQDYMIKNILISAMTVSMMLFLLTACAEDDQASSAAGKTATVEAPDAAKAKRPARPAAQKPEPRPLEDFQSAAVMSEPVDFSSPEQITASLDKIKRSAGEEAASRVQIAIDYLLVYDLGVGRNKQKLNEKLNGKTPNEILAMTNR